MKGKSGFKWVLAFVLVTLTAIFTWSCSDGGGETPSVAVIDQRTAENTEFIARSFPTRTTYSVSFPSPGTDSGSPPLSSKTWGNRILLRAGNVARMGHTDNENGVVRAGSYSESQPCEISGTMNLSGDWIGGPDGSDLFSEASCEATDPTWTFTFTDCIEDDEMFDGRLSMDYSGSMCSPSAISGSYSNFSWDDGEDSFEIVALDSDMADLQWGGDNNSMTSYRLTLNGDITTKDVFVEFDQFQSVVAHDGSIETISSNGRLTGGCFDGWVTVTTISPLRRRLDDECPHAGTVKFMGADDVVITVVYNSDGSMDIGDQHYDTCNAAALPNQCL